MTVTALDKSLQGPDHMGMATQKTPAKERLVVEATPEFRRQVEEAAEYEALTLSAFVRRVLTLYMRQVREDTATH